MHTTPVTRSDTAELTRRRLSALQRHGELRWRLSLPQPVERRFP